MKKSSELEQDITAYIERPAGSLAQGSSDVSARHYDLDRVRVSVLGGGSIKDLRDFVNCIRLVRFSVRFQLDKGLTIASPR